MSICTFYVCSVNLCELVNDVFIIKNLSYHLAANIIREYIIIWDLRECSNNYILLKENLF